MHLACFGRLSVLLPSLVTLPGTGSEERPRLASPQKDADLAIMLANDSPCLLREVHKSQKKEVFRAFWSLAGYYPHVKVESNPQGNHPALMISRMAAGSGLAMGSDDGKGRGSPNFRTSGRSTDSMLKVFCGIAVLLIM